MAQLDHIANKHSYLNFIICRHRDAFMTSDYPSEVQNYKIYTTLIIV